jgi:N utilization substance protein A
MDRELEAIIAREAGDGVERGSLEDEEIEREDIESRSDAYSDADRRGEEIEQENDTLDTLVDESQDVSSEGIDNV